MHTSHVTSNGFTNFVDEIIILVELGKRTLKQRHNHALDLLLEALEIDLVHGASHLAYKLMSEQLRHLSILIEGHFRDIKRLFGDNLANSRLSINLEQLSGEPPFPFL